MSALKKSEIIRINTLHLLLDDKFQEELLEVVADIGEYLGEVS